MKESSSNPISLVWQGLERWGLLLESDRVLPSVASIVAGMPIRGSWWGHESGGAIYGALQALRDRDDVLRVSLLSGKITFVHPHLVPAVLAIAQARESWQLADLGSAAASLLDLVDECGVVRLDSLPRTDRAMREAARELERRLLVHGDEAHTRSGAHTKVIEAWSLWPNRARGHAALPAPSEAKETLEAVASVLNRTFEARASLPWQGGGQRGSRAWSR